MMYNDQLVYKVVMWAVSWISKWKEKVALMIHHVETKGKYFLKCYNIKQMECLHYSHTLRPIVFIQPCVQDMSIIICAYHAYRVAIK